MKVEREQKTTIKVARGMVIHQSSEPLAVLIGLSGGRVHGTAELDELIEALCEIRQCLDPTPNMFVPLPDETPERRTGVRR
jgi:hypothetical protein